MKNSFCEELVSACEGQIDFPTYDGQSYCEKHTLGSSSDAYWSYPLDPEGRPQHDRSDPIRPKSFLPISSMWKYILYVHAWLGDAFVII